MFERLICKILRKLKIGIILYPVIYLFNSFFKDMKLPTFDKAYHIINNKSVTHKTYHYCNKSINDKKNCCVEFDVQIIIPVYNSERYIQECLESILAQNTSYTFQIIVINDGSTDNTINLLKKYKYNPLIKIINISNHGRSYARNVGLDNANNCNYIMFVDSDDKLSFNAVQSLLDNAYKLHSDISFGGYSIFYDKKIDSINEYMNNDNITLKSSDDINGYLWGKVFKSSLFKLIRFPVGYEFEDTILAFWIYPKCKLISSINQNVYYYRDNPKSISHTFKNSNVSIDSYLITQLLIKNLNKYHISIDQYLYNTFLAQVKMNCLRNIYMDKNIQKSIFVLTCNIFDKYFSEFKTNIMQYKFLEKSIKDHNYNNYVLYCLIV